MWSTRDETLTGATTPVQGEPGSNGNIEETSHSLVVVVGLTFLQVIQSGNSKPC